MPRETPSAPISASDAIASVVSRTIGAAIDLVLLLGIDLLVLYFTLQISGILWADRAALPKVPLLAFFVVQNLGYLMAFTAGGQTLGQMAMGVKVVAGDDNRPPPLGQAILRTLVWVVLALPAGLGLLSILFDKDRRGLHDRTAHTRVIRL